MLDRFLRYGLSPLVVGAALFGGVTPLQATDKRPNILVMSPARSTKVERASALAQDLSEKNNVAAEHPDKVAQLQKRIDELAKTSAKPLFLVEQFKAMQKGLQGEPALPNEDAYYQQEMP